MRALVSHPFIRRDAAPLVKGSSRRVELLRASSACLAAHLEKRGEGAPHRLLQPTFDTHTRGSHDSRPGDALRRRWGAEVHLTTDPGLRGNRRHLPEEGAPHRAAPSRRGVVDRVRRLAIPPLTPPSRPRRSRVNPRVAAGAKTASADLTSMRAASPAGVPSIDRCSHDEPARDDLGRTSRASPVRTLLSLASDGNPPPVSWLCRRRPGVRRHFASPMALARGG
jgi:hypothetical protein